LPEASVPSGGHRPKSHTGAIAEYHRHIRQGGIHDGQAGATARQSAPEPTYLTNSSRAVGSSSAPPGCDADSQFTEPIARSAQRPRRLRDKTVAKTSSSIGCRRAWGSKQRCFCPGVRETISKGRHYKRGSTRTAPTATVSTVCLPPIGAPVQRGYCNRFNCDLIPYELCGPVELV
jgi:hypothetical protein